ncbi:unnamed protein product [Brassica rapa subsp. trilocularis]
MQVRATITCPGEVGVIMMSCGGFMVHMKSSTTDESVLNNYTKLSCAGFQSVTPVATSLLSTTGDICLLNAGNFILPNVDFVFKYVWDTSFDLKVIDWCNRLQLNTIPEVFRLRYFTVLTDRFVHSMNSIPGFDIMQGYHKMIGFGCSRSFSDISLKQSKTGKMVKNTPEWEVTLTNPCSCTGTDITLTCDGFKSLTPIDPSQILVAGDECSLINNLYGETDFVFKYVWAEEFDIKIKSGEIACS